MMDLKNSCADSDDLSAQARREFLERCLNTKVITPPTTTRLWPPATRVMISSLWPAYPFLFFAQAKNCNPDIKDASVND